MDSQKQQASERIKQANNILVTVSNNPSVDQLAACIGVTVALNKMGKHATAVYSGSTPSTIEFLQPEKTLEKNTDSLRDFIIALDKSKADKLRYKVEDRVVKIFITPYKTSISDKDLEFSQGDFNVDAILALGVHNQSELDQAITSHGRILHDATIITLNTKPGGELGSINWLDPGASSLSELAVELIDSLDKKLIDTQIATALLTGIVAETERFSNSKTSPQTMSISAELMADGANQQLVATKLEEPAPAPSATNAPIAHQEGDQPASEVQEETPKRPDDGTLEISHEDKPAESPAEPPKEEKPQDAEPKQEEKRDGGQSPELSLPAQPEPESQPVSEPPQIHIDEHGSLSSLEDTLPPKPKDQPLIRRHNEPPKMVLELPALESASAPFAAAQAGEGLGLPTPEPQPVGLGLPPAITPASSGNLLPTLPDTSAESDELPSGGAAPSDSYLVGAPKVIDPAGAVMPQPNKTLSDIERDVHSTHADPQPTPIQAPTVITPTVVPPMPAMASDAGILPSLQPSTQDAGVLPFTAAGPMAQQSFPPAMDLPGAQPATQPLSPIVQPPVLPAASPPAVDVPTVDSARDAVAEAINGASSSTLDPTESLNTQPANLPMGQKDQVMAQTPQQPTWGAGSDPSLQELTTPGLAAFNKPINPGPLPAPTDPNAPPAVPPPMMPPTNPY